MSRAGVFTRPGTRTHPAARSGPPRRDRRVGVVVRPATPRDAAAVTDLRVALLLAEAAPERPAAPRARVERRARRLTESQLADAQRRGSRQALFVAEDLARGEHVVGVLRCVVVRSSSFALPGRYALVTTAFVQPAYRRRGVLRRLLRAADAWARGSGIAEMRLHCAVRNQVGSLAWAALGFAPIETLYQRLVPPEP